MSETLLEDGSLILSIPNGDGFFRMFAVLDFLDPPYEIEARSLDGHFTARRTICWSTLSLHEHVAEAEQEIRRLRQAGHADAEEMIVVGRQLGLDPV